MKRSASIIMGVAAVAVVGCKHKPNAHAAAPSPPPRVMQAIAVVNVEQVTKAVGWDVEIGRGIALERRRLEDSCDHQLADLFHRAMAVRQRIAKAAQLNAAQSARVMNVQNAEQLADLPLTEEQRHELVASSIETNQAVEKVRRDYQEQLDKQTHDLLESYRKLAMPMAQRVAQKEGFRIVIANSADVLYHDPSTDVSQQVIDEFNSVKPTWEQSKEQ
ncbi:MAG TPA: OmpH family outer membrane protein [Tepidisphaeraceae bacterium]|jgi:Skp family chaperone for outer membrane proteins|nr:OmpH family outer membrane protein [Tepidisphaeraceae bacterium]